MVAQVKSPVVKEVYPVVPFAFLNNDRFLAVRINQERTIIISEWRTDIILTTRNIGGTISEGCVAISYDESYLVSWPFGYIETYDLIKIVSKLKSKISMKYRWPIVLLKTLVSKGRATSSSAAIKDVLRYDDNVFKMILMYL